MEWEHSIPTAPEWAANEIARLKTELALARLERDNIASLNSSLIAELAAIRHLPMHLGGGRSGGRPPPLSAARSIEMEPDKWTSIETVTELAEAKARIAHERVEGDKISAALEMANVRVAELDAHMANEYARCEAWKARAERAEARIAELEATRLHWTGEVARLTQDSCDDQDRAERAEAECKALRETVRKIRATDNITAVWHIADAALASFPAGREG